MLKKLNKKEVEMFVKKFEIKCTKVLIEVVDDKYYVNLDDITRFQINNFNLIKELIM